MTTARLGKQQQKWQVYDKVKNQQQQWWQQHDKVKKQQWSQHDKVKITTKTIMTTARLGRKSNKNKKQRRQHHDKVKKTPTTTTKNNATMTTKWQMNNIANASNYENKKDKIKNHKSNSRGWIQRQFRRQKW